MLAGRSGKISAGMAIGVMGAEPGDGTVQVLAELALLTCASVCGDDVEEWVYARSREAERVLGWFCAGGQG